jgi:hypothetical protein
MLVAISLQARAPQRRGSFRLQILMISLPRVVMLPNYRLPRLHVPSGTGGCSQNAHCKSVDVGADE